MGGNGKGLDIHQGLGYWSLCFNSKNISLNAITNRGLPLRSLDAGRSPAHFSCTFTSLGRKKNKIPNEGLACSDAVSLNVI